MSYRPLWSVPIRISAGVLGVWVADLVVSAFRIDGSRTVQLLVGGVVAAISFAAGVAIMFAIAAPLSTVAVAVPNLARVLRGHGPTGGSGGDAGENVPRPAVLGLIRGTLHVTGIAVVSPVAFFLAVRACRVVGMPVEVSGGWAGYLTVGLVATAVWGAVSDALVPPAKRTQWRRWAATRVAYVAVAVVLWLAVRYVDGVQLAAADDRPQFVDILVLAAVLCSLQLPATGRWSALAQAPLDVLALWVLAWVGAWLANPLEFSGAGPLVLTAVVITAVTLPLWLLAPPPRPDPARATGAPRWGRLR